MFGDVNVEDMPPIVLQPTTGCGCNVGGSGRPNISRPYAGYSSDDVCTAAEVNRSVHTIQQAGCYALRPTIGPALLDEPADNSPKLQELEEIGGLAEVH